MLLCELHPTATRQAPVLPDGTALAPHAYVLLCCWCLSFALQNTFPDLMQLVKIRVVEMLDHVLATYNPRAGEYTAKLWERQGEWTKQKKKGSFPFHTQPKGKATCVQGNMLQAYLCQPQHDVSACSVCCHTRRPGAMGADSESAASKHSGKMRPGCLLRRLQASSCC